MSLKHLKFDESFTMRSFEKLAQEKDLIKNDPIKKEASKKLDLSASNNLSDNILKLIAGLNQNGFNKYAEELRNSFLVFKEAQSLYGVNKETGEDVVNQAHPKGSPDISDVEGDATVETVLDQHNKILEIINKKTTGKFANNKQIIDAVKLVFASAKDEVKDFLEKAVNYFSQAVSKGLQLDQLMETNVESILKNLNEAKQIFNSKKDTSLDFTRDDILKIEKCVGSAYQTFKPGVFGGLDDLKAWKDISTLLSYAQGQLENAKKLSLSIMLGNADKDESAKKTQELKAVNVESDPLLVKIQSQINRLNGFESIINSQFQSKKITEEQKNESIKWIRDAISELNSTRERLETISPESRTNEVKSYYENEINKNNEALDGFYNEWLK